MGQLINKNNLPLDPSWYFSDARDDWQNRGWYYEWPSPDFPYRAAIHYEEIGRDRSLRRTIRSWIEETLPDTIIFDTVDKHYRVYYGNERSWDRSFEQSNNWLVFYFSREDTFLMFKLRFSDYIKELTELNPYRKDIYEKTSYYTTSE